MLTIFQNRHHVVTIEDEIALKKKKKNYAYLCGVCNPQGGQR